MTQTFYFMRLPLKLDRLGQMAAERGWLSRKGAATDDGLALHHALAEVFGQGILKPYRLMAAPRGREGAIYAYTDKDAEVLQSLISICPPEYDQLFDMQALTVKPMPHQFSEGQRLGFNIRLRPIKRVNDDALGGDGREMDVFLHEALTAYPNGAGDVEANMLSAGRTREAVYRDWLIGRLGTAAAFMEKPLPQLVQFKRSIAVRNGRSVEGPDAILQGDLIVREPGAFAQILRHGVGRHKAYGYGMLLLRPPGSG